MALPEPAGPILKQNIVPDYAKETAEPEADVERGSMFDLFSAPLVFAWGMDGKNIAEMFDVGKPTVGALSQYLQTDGTGRQLFQALTLPIRKTSWTIEPSGKANAQDDEIVGQVTDWLREPLADGGMQTPMSDVIGQMTGAFVYRRSFFEKVWQVTGDGRRWRYKKLAHRPQDSCIMLRDAINGDVRGFKQRVPLNTENPYVGPDGYVPITQQYSYIYVHGTHMDPVFGISDFDVPYSIYQTKAKVMFLWFSFLEITGLPRLIFHGSSETNAKSAAKILAQLRANGVAGIPESWGKQLTQLQAGTNQTAYHTAIDYLDGQAADSLLAGWTRMTSRGTGSGVGAGSYALSRDQSGLFLDLMQAYSSEMADSITNYVVSDLVKYNWGPDAKVPKFSFGVLNQDDIQLQATMLQTLGVAQNMNPAIPGAFLTDLMMAVAKTFGMDLDKLAQEVSKAQLQIEQTTRDQKLAQMSQIMATADVAARQIAAAKLQANSPSASVAQPTKAPSPVQNGNGSGH